jgi:hypothetical protein
MVAPVVLEHNDERRLRARRVAARHHAGEAGRLRTQPGRRPGAGMEDLRPRARQWQAPAGGRRAPNPDLRPRPGTRFCGTTLLVSRGGLEIPASHRDLVQCLSRRS